MPKATISHREKKDGAARERWMERKRVLRYDLAGSTAKLQQNLWRRAALKDRGMNRKLTEKNRKEIDTVFGDCAQAKVLQSQIAA